MPCTIQEVLAIVCEFANLLHRNIINTSKVMKHLLNLLKISLLNAWIFPKFNLPIFHTTQYIQIYFLYYMNPQFLYLYLLLVRLFLLDFLRMIPVERSPSLSSSSPVEPSVTKYDEIFQVFYHNYSNIMHCISWSLAMCNDAIPLFVYKC